MAGPRRRGVPILLRLSPACPPRVQSRRNSHSRARTEIRNPKHEIRNKSQIRMKTTNNEAGQAPCRPAPLPFSLFGFGICFGFRASGFGFLSAPAPALLGEEEGVSRLEE